MARLHAAKAGSPSTTAPTTAEALAQAGERFDVVLAMEVVEHVADVDAFIAACAKLLKPGGLLFVATINRTPKAFALAIVGAEYVLRWLPRGTHDYAKLVRPSELEIGVRRRRALRAERTGVRYNPLTDSWSCAADMDVNYMVVGGEDRRADARRDCLARRTAPKALPSPRGQSRRASAPNPGRAMTAA